MFQKFARISVFFLLLMYLLIPVLAEIDVAYYSLKHPISYAPNGRVAVMIVEDRYVGGSLFGLTLLALDPRNGTQSIGMESLTPDYKEVVAIPGSTNFAYLQYDPVYSDSVNLFMPETGKQTTGFTYASFGKTLEQIQFSKDGKYFCYFSPNAPHPFSSASIKRKDKMRRMLQKVDGWVIMNLVDGRTIKPEGKEDITLHFTDAEKEAFTEWAPIEKPSKIPKIFTQPMPTISLDTKVQWSPDPSTKVPYIYVSDDTGIWCVPTGTALPVFLPMWTKLVNAERIHRFQVSPTQTHLVYEVRPDLSKRTKEEQNADPLGLENDIYLVDIRHFFVEKPKKKLMEWELDVTAELSPTKIAKGWGATFNPNGKSMIYSNTKATNIISLETMKHYWVDETIRPYK